MKKIFILFYAIIAFAITTNAQRYSKAIFSNVTATNNITYGSANNYLGINQNLKLDFYEPTGDVLTKRPLIVFIHGGGFVDPTETKSLGHIIAFADSFAKRGYVVASIDYRLDLFICNRAVINAMHDARASIRFLKANASTYKIDTNLIFIAGESAGAVTALNVNYMTAPSETNFPASTPIATNTTLDGASGSAGYSSKGNATLCFCGGTKTVLNNDMFDTNTIKLSTDPPLLQVHGTADPLIPIARGLEVSVRAVHKNVPNLFYTFNGATHCPWYATLPNGQLYLDSLVDYTSSFLYAFFAPSKINNYNSQKLIDKIYPNPCNQYISITNYEKYESFSIADINGKIISTAKISEKISTNQIANGIYILSLKKNGEIFSQQFEILH
jgi:acetyl esterase/lipase